MGKPGAGTRRNKNDLHKNVESGCNLAEVLAVVRTCFPSTPSIADGAEACISAICALLLADTEGCPALVLEGPASSGKTTVLDFIKGNKLRKEGLVEASDYFSAASFVTHAANISKSELGGIDLLPRISHKTLVVPDLAPTFSAREEDLTKNLGVLTRVLDGQGYESDSGTHGHRGYSGDYRFALLAATTPLTSVAWKTMARLGNRILVIDVGSEQVATDDLVASMRGKVSYQENVRSCTEAVGGLLLRLWKDTGGYGSIQWDSTADDQSLLKVIALVAQWVVRCRGTVSTDEGSLEGANHSTVHVEAPHRLVNGLYSMAKGHAVASGRKVLSKEDVQFVTRVALDSMPIDRRRVVRVLIAAKSGLMTSAEGEKALDRSRPTARKVMNELVALGAVVSRVGKGETIGLAESEQWLSEEAFRWVVSRIP